MKHAVFTLLAVLSLAACDDGGGDKQEVNKKAIAEAKKVWETKCITCHGPKGLGDGEAGKELDPKPRNFTMATWQNSTDDARIRKVIVEGGASVGLSDKMTANPELADKPEVVTELLKKIRSFKKT